MEIVTYPSTKLDNFVDLLWREKLFSEILTSDTSDEIYFGCKHNQVFVKRIMHPMTDCDILMLFHTMGSGKTDCAAITYDINIGKYKKALFICKGPGSIISLKQTLKSWIMRYKGEEGDRYMEDHFEFVKFVSFSKKISSNFSEIVKKYNNHVIIIDEVHNLRNESDKDTAFYNIVRFFNSVKDCKKIIMTGTPMYDNENELKTITKFLNDSEDNRKDVEQIYKNKVSYYNIVEGGPEMIYVTNDKGDLLRERGVTKYAVVALEMKGEQLRMYNKYQKEDSFLRKPQLISLAVGPKNLNEETNMNKEAINRALYTDAYTFNKKHGMFLKGEMEKGNINEYSVKFDHVFNCISQLEGTAYIFSELVEGYGIRFFASMFKIVGYSIATEDDWYNKKVLTKRKRVLVITGREDGSKLEDIERIREIFNSKENIDGSYIKVLLGSLMTGEGWNLYNVRQVYILTPHWNISRIAQVEARVCRTNSHIALPEEEKKVYIFRYVALPCPIDEVYASVGSDLRKYDMSESKEGNIERLEEELKGAAIDAPLTTFEVQDTKVNSLYINYHINTVMERVAERLLDLKEGKTSKEISKYTNIREEVIKPMLYELANEKRYIHIGNLVFKLGYSDGMFYTLDFDDRFFSPKPNMIDITPIERRRDDYEELYESFIGEESYLVEKLSTIKQSELIEIVRMSIENDNKELINFFRNMVVYDKVWYEASSLFSRSNSNHNKNEELRASLYISYIYKYDKVWVKCNDEEAQRIGLILVEKIKEDSMRFEDCRFAPFISYYNGGALYIRDTKRDTWEKRSKVFRGRQINLFPAGNDFNHMLVSIMLETIGPEILEEYLEHKTINITIDEALYEISKTYEFWSVSYINVFKMIGYILKITKRKDKIDIIKELIINTRSYYLR